MQTKLVIASPGGISVLMTEQGRLEIVADVDAGELRALRNMLDLYATILALHPAYAKPFPSLPESP